MDNKLTSLYIVLFGSSSSVQFGHENLLLGEKQTRMENTEVSMIDPLQKKISEWHISVFNMIDFHETELYLDCVDHHIDQLVNENEIHVFIFVVRLGQLTNDDKMGLEWLQRVFGVKVLQFVMILFTYEREKEYNTIKYDLKKNPDLEQLLEKCGGRYQACNKMMNNQSEMRDLMKKIEHLFNENQQQRYTGEMFSTASIRKKELGNSEHQSGTARVSPAWAAPTQWLRSLTAQVSRIAFFTEATALSTGASDAPACPPLPAPPCRASVRRTRGSMPLLCSEQLGFLWRLRGRDCHQRGYVLDGIRRRRMLRFWRGA
ncbi:hypothetical protein G5714_003968 [Onychostoma macrolepis]|uniref:AIG1-type G domain-containing protein n=1 Tax=Onychostoma macrolepis TaxID=369639 RepID=A0A7J6DBA5_9TELE|nr:hypothetical protein G5714_003968 [Onychostoma macrolepis]